MQAERKSDFRGTTAMSQHGMFELEQNACTHHFSAWSEVKGINSTRIHELSDWLPIAPQWPWVSHSPPLLPSSYMRVCKQYLFTCLRVCSYPVGSAQGSWRTGCSCEPVRWDLVCGRSCRWGRRPVALSSAAAAWPAGTALPTSLRWTQQDRIAHAQKYYSSDWF